MPDKKDYIIINGRVLIESIIKSKDTNRIINSTTELLDLTLKYFKEKEIKIPTFKSFIVDTSIGCTREINRHHDNFYICEQSTRYCDFSKDKFGNEVAFNKPYWYDEADNYWRRAWESAMQHQSARYCNAVDKDGFNVSTDIARGLLPLDTHTRAIYTATVEEWKHFIDMRLHGNTGKPHGDIKVIAEKINNLING
jgi:thymidylate synthase (FAD)